MKKAIALLTALFFAFGVASAQDIFTLTVEADSTGWGTVNGGGSYSLGDTATIEAFANIGYEFLYWNDSITNNPLHVIVTQDSTFIAHFGPIAYTEHTINTLSIPENAGTVNGGGIHHYGDTITLEALPNPGYFFEMWSDSVTDNPRDIVVTQDSTFTAHFGLSEYTITTAVDPENAGTVTEGGIYHYGDTITLEAVPNLGHFFEMWSDSVTDNPRDVIVTQDCNFTAHFGLKQYTIIGIATPDGAGYVVGDGTYYYGDTVSLFAHNNPGYFFVRWLDGSADNPREVVVKRNATYTAYFEPLEYVITTSCDPEEGGTVAGGGTYHYGESITLIATPNPNYSFVCWSDGIVTNPRGVTVTEDASYKAMFQYNEVPSYSIKVMPNDPTLGEVTGSGEYPEGTVIEISATPNTHAIFTEWDDGNTENPRRLEVTCDMIIIAMFEALPQYTITVRPQSAAMGSTYGSGSYPQQSVVTIGATPNDGYYFNGWEDGDMSNPRTIIVTADATYVALFTATPVDTYSVTVYYDENQGIILGANTNYPVGATASLVAIPADGYVFVRWSDGTTDNPKVVIVDHDIVLAAFFNYTDVDENGMNAVSLYPNPASDKLHLEGIEGKHDIQIYNAIGTLVKTSSLNGDGEIDINDLSAGLYLLRINGHTMRFVKK